MSFQVSSLDTSNTLYLLVDVQPSLLKSIKDAEILVAETKVAIEIFKKLSLILYFTDQNKEKLGSCKEVFTNLEGILSHNKMTFSSLRHSELLSEMKQLGIQNVVLSGLETHICILQTAYDLLSHGIGVYLLADLSRSIHEEDHKLALDAMRAKGVEVTTLSSFTYRLLKSAEHPQFKEILKEMKPLIDERGLRESI